jgi:tRNA-dihydrouridine synthase A
VNIPVTVKCRIGVDAQDEYEDLHKFVEPLVAAGLEALIVHARKAWLHGLSPKENREIPPLNYPRVYQLKREFPMLRVVINGGIHDVDAAKAHLAHADGVMLGRSAYHDPYVLAKLEHALFGTPLPDRDAVLACMQPYIDAHVHGGDTLNHVARHLLGLYLGLPGARAFRRYLSEHMHRPAADFRAIAGAIAAMQMQRQAA